MSQKTEEPLTPRQVQVLNTITDFYGSRGYSPTIGELAERLGISRTTAFEHIGQLRKKELISGQAGRARSLTLTSKTRRLLKQLRDSSLVSPERDSAKGFVTRRSNKYQESNIENQNGGIPLVGKVAAGMPVEAIENKERLSIESCFGNRNDVFALEVRGDSMIGENIREGDYVICRRTADATNGQLVVAIVDNDNATLKRFYKEGERARLQPANDAYEPIYSDNCRIEGVVIGLVRKL